MCLMVVALFIVPPYLAHALDMSRLQSAFRRLNGKPQAFLDWQKLIIDNRELSSADKLTLVNKFFNRHIEFASDQEAWNQADYWATPMELLSKGRGDCEDFVIAKYFSLLNLNVPIEKLRLIYVKALIPESSGNTLQAHMVLAYYPTPMAEPLLLDNLSSEILPASRRLDLQPVFSFNSRGIFTSLGATASLGQGGVGRYTRWQELLQRARDEGFE